MYMCSSTSCTLIISPSPPLPSSPPPLPPPPPPSSCYPSRLDLDVTHLQLLLFVWHNFSPDTRRMLLLQCVRAAIHVAEEKQSVEYTCAC